MRNVFGSYLLISFVLGLSACASTQLVSTWRAEGDIKPVKNILVIGISDNTRDRRIFEEEFVRQLNSQGVKAAVSYEKLPDSEKISRESVQKAIEGTDFDAVLVTHYEGTNEETVYRPGTTYSVGFRDAGYYGYYGGVYNDVHTPGYYVKYKYVFLETSVYSVADSKPIWSARSKTTNPENINKDILELSKAVIASLKKNGVIATSKN